MSDPDQNDGRTKIHIAVIGAFQAIIVAAATASAQYFATIAPLKSELKVAQQTAVSQPEKASQKPETGANDKAPKLSEMVTEASALKAVLSLPPGESLAFQYDYLISTAMFMREKRGEDKKWDKDCRTRVIAELMRLQFRIVIDNGTAIRGEREGVQLGALCLSRLDLVWLYGVSLRRDFEKAVYYKERLNESLVESAEGDFD